MAVALVVAVPLTTETVLANPTCTATTEITAPSANDNDSHQSGSRVVHIAAAESIIVTGATPNSVIGIAWTMEFRIDGNLAIGAYAPGSTTYPYAVVPTDANGSYQNVGTLAGSGPLAFGDHAFESYIDAYGDGIADSHQTKNATYHIDALTNGGTPIDPPPVGS